MRLWLFLVSIATPQGSTTASILTSVRGPVAHTMGTLTKWMSAATNLTFAQKGSKRALTRSSPAHQMLARTETCLRR